jgi:hypothetical protein
MSNRLPLGGQLSGDEIRLWREGYRRYLIGKGMPSEAASDIAATGLRGDRWSIGTISTSSSARSTKGSSRSKISKELFGWR